MYGVQRGSLGDRLPLLLSGDAGPRGLEVETGQGRSSLPVQAREFHGLAAGYDGREKAQKCRQSTEVHAVLNRRGGVIVFFPRADKAPSLRAGLYEIQVCNHRKMVAELRPYHSGHLWFEVADVDVVDPRHGKAVDGRPTPPGPALLPG